MFGFPDILFQPNDAFVQLLARQTTTKADVVLGLFIAHNPQAMDMAARQEDGRIYLVEIKPSTSLLRYAWIIAIWTPAFSAFMHDFLSSFKAPERKEL